MAEEIDTRELEQAKLIIAETSLRKGLAKCGTDLTMPHAIGDRGQARGATDAPSMR